MSKLFVDSSAWVALFSREDQRYEAAMAFWGNVIPAERIQLITSDYVMDETYTLLRRRRNGLQRAIAAHQVVEETGVVQLLEVDAELRERAWALFRKYDDKVLSFTDCVCFAMMHNLGIYEAFSFDHDFERAGFVIRP